MIWQSKGWMEGRRDQRPQTNNQVLEHLESSSLCSENLSLELRSSDPNSTLNLKQNNLLTLGPLTYLMTVLCLRGVVL